MARSKDKGKPPPITLIKKPAKKPAKKPKK